jgi:hypothetical protein
MSSVKAKCLEMLLYVRMPQYPSILNSEDPIDHSLTPHLHPHPHPTPHRLTDLHQEGILQTFPKTTLNHPTDLHQDVILQTSRRPPPPEPPVPPRRKGLNDSSLTTGEIVGIATGTVAGAGALAAGARAATASAEVATGAGEIEMVGGAGMSEAEFVAAYGGASATGLEAGAGAAAAVTEGAAVAETASLLGAETAILGTSAALAPETLGLSLVVGGLVAGGMAAAGLFKHHPKAPQQPPPISEAGQGIIERYAESDRQQADLASRDVMDSDGSGFTREGKHYVEVP